VLVLPTSIGMENLKDAITIVVQALTKKASKPA